MNSHTIDRYIPLKFGSSEKKELEAQRAYKPHHQNHEILRGLGEVFKGSVKFINLQGKVSHYPSAKPN